MKTKTKKDEKKCLKCKRIIVGGSIIGLCPSCFNDYGSWGAGIGIGGIISIGTRWVWKNGEKVAKGAFDLIKLIKS